MEKFIKILKNKDGVALVMMALMITVFFGFSALAVDVGSVAYTKSRLQNAADAAALAGAQALPEVTATDTAVDYAGKNGLKSIENGVKLDGDTVTAVPEDNSTRIRVVCKRDIQFYFAQLLGFPGTTVEESAVAQIGVSGLRPWALKGRDEEYGTFQYGDAVVIKDGAGWGDHGYYGVIGFYDGDTNANKYLLNVKNGSKNIISIGDLVYNGSGVKNNITAAIGELMDDNTDDYTDLTRITSRVVLIPKINPDNNEVIGFAVVYLQKYAKNSGNEYKDINVTGYDDPVTLKTGELIINVLYDTTWSEEYKEEIEDDYPWLEDFVSDSLYSVKLVE